MKRLGWLAALLLPLWLGCPEDKSAQDAGGLDAGPKELVEAEPNDRPDQAQAVSETAIVSARLSADPSKPDEDWFALTSPSPRVVDVAVSGIPAGDVAIYLMDADRNQLAAVNSEGEGKPERLPNLSVSGKAFVKVAGVKKGAGGSYALSLRFSEPVSGFEAEPNDRAVDANAASLSQPVSGYLGHAADEDWFRFELPSAEPAPGAVAEVDAGGPAAPEADGGAEAAAEGPKIALRIDLSSVSGVRFELSVLSAAEAPLFQVKGKDGEGLSLRNVGVRAMDRMVYLVVKSAWTGTGKEARRSYNPDLSYSLSVVPEEAGANAEYEPNDEPFKATLLPRDGFREGFLSPKGDVDYYVLKADQPVLAKVQLSGVERVDLVLQLVKPPEEAGGAEQVVMKVNDGAVKEPEIVNNLLCANECWFKVEGGVRKVDGKMVRDFENAEVPYRLSVSAVPDDGSEEREPNGSAEAATPLAIGRPVRGTVHPKKDLDFYRLDLSGRPVKTSLKFTATGILKVDVGLYLHRLDEEGKPSLVQTADRAKGETPEVIRFTAEPGVYLVEVRDSKNRESNFQDAYQLSVEEGE
ncbi:MAG: ABC transporter substrate-binding protein [Myxococcales bacterium]|nr:ABC transporter substrate-binding protein [Myxococcales bacterium]